MTRAMIIALAALLVTPAAAVAGNRKLPELHHRTLATIPMAMYKEDCKLKNAVKLNAKATADAKNPGAGMEKFEPFQKVLKDGFYMVDCVKDKLLEFGDKFGDGKFAYNMGSISNVSIVHYTEVVPKEDQEPMTHEVCFSFCRTAPDMNFFGIHNGRDCYCAPYYQAMESDSTQCDATCEGQTTQMCGGKVKSSIFGMHQCADTAAVMSEASSKATDAEGVLDGDVSDLEAISTSMQTGAADLQARLGQAGDPKASDLMQAAKVFAGELEHTAEDKKSILTEITTMTGEATGLEQADMTTYENIDKAEEVTDSLEKLTADAEAAAEELEGLIKLSSPTSEDATDAAKQYYPIMYFVDKEYEEVPTTCSGDEVAKPMASISEDECAHNCNANFQKCVGYSYYAAEELCFMFSKFKTVQYYTGCGGGDDQQGAAQQGGTRFLQINKKKSFGAACKAKLSEFEGTNITPDGSGKCKGCLKEANKADRCP